MAQLDDPPELDPLRIVPTVFTANGDEIPSTVGQRVEDKLLLPREIEHPWSSFASTNETALKALFGPEPHVVGTARTHLCSGMPSGHS